MLPPVLNKSCQTVTATGLGIAGGSVEVPYNQRRTSAKSISFAQKPIPRQTLQCTLLRRERRHSKPKNSEVGTSQRHSQNIRQHGGVNMGRYQLIPALHVARSNEHLILAARLGRTGEFRKPTNIETGEKEIMVWSFNILRQDKDIRSLFIDGRSDPRGNLSACSSMIQVPSKEFHI
jgi:hypothetical protein